MWKCFKRLTLETVTTTSDDEGSAYDELIMNTSMKGLKVGHLNVNGLVGKMSEIRNLLRETKFDYTWYNRISPRQGCYEQGYFCRLL